MGAWRRAPVIGLVPGRLQASDRADDHAGYHRGLPHDAGTGVLHRVPEPRRLPVGQRRDRLYDQVSDVGLRHRRQQPGQLVSTWGYGDERRANTDAFRADGSYTVGGFIRSIDVGIRYNTRDISVSEYKLLAPVTVDGVGTLGGPGDLYFFKDAGIGHTGNPAIEGLSVLPIYSFAQLGNSARNYNNFIFGGVPAAGIPALDPNVMSDPLAFQNSLYPGNEAYNDPTRSFRVKERTGTAYGQMNFGTEEGALGSFGLSGNVGLRYTTTRRLVYSNTTIPTRFIGTGGNYNGVFLNLGTNVTSKNINRWLPSANLTLDINDRQKLRFAAAKVVGELNLFDLGAGQVLYYGANNGRYPDLPSTLQVFLQGNSGQPQPGAVPGEHLQRLVRVLLRQRRIAERGGVPVRHQVVPAIDQHNPAHRRCGWRGSRGRFDLDDRKRHGWQDQGTGARLPATIRLPARPAGAASVRTRTSPCPTARARTTTCSASNCRCRTIRSISTT